MKNKILVGLVIVIVVALVVYLLQKDKSIYEIINKAKEVLAEFNIVSTTPAESKPNNNSSSKNNNPKVTQPNSSNAPINKAYIKYNNKTGRRVRIELDDNRGRSMSWDLGVGQDKVFQIDLNVSYREKIIDLIDYGFNRGTAYRFTSTPNQTMIINLL